MNTNRIGGKNSFRSATNRLRTYLSMDFGDLDNLVGGIGETLAAKDEVLRRFGPMFSPGNVQNLTEDDLREFLQPSQNKHWSGLSRQLNKLTADMDLLRSALSLLVDESQPLPSRLEQLRPKNASPMVPGLARSVITAVLQVVYPDQYGVWNNTSEAAMRELKILPDFPPGATLAQKYPVVNEVLLQLCSDLGTDLWTLDALWWVVKQGDNGSGDNGSGDNGTEDEESRLLFGLEAYLQAFLRDNWEHTTLATEWALYEVDGELAGYEFDTGEVGRIDLLAKHLTDNRWLVIELKKNQTSDRTVGQALRYMGWVKEHLADLDDSVEGIIIAHEFDNRIQYALSFAKEVRLFLYEVDFRLKDPILEQARA